jgi:glutamine synthetase
MMVGPEIEFFLFEKGKNGEPTTQTHDAAGYFDLLPVDRGEEARHDMISALERMGFEIEAAHHEVAPSQHEIDFVYADALTTADRVVTFRLVVKTIALDHGLHATFMPKPIFAENGSGMHTNQSLFKNGANVFYNPDGDMKLSDICRQYVSGLIEHVRGMAIFTNPTINSYKRLVPGYEAPVRIAWSERNRSPLIRIPAARGKSTRIELRNPDPSCNPYLSLACMLAAGLDGVTRKLEPPPPIDANVYEMSAYELEQLNIGTLPANMIEAVKAFEEDELMRDAVGAHIADFISRAKREEWIQYSAQVTQWEQDRYLKVY